MFGQLKYPSERVDLMTDRSIYLSGESVLFSGILSTIKDENTLSKVAYIEVITPSGQKINQVKVKILNDHFDGQIYIPADALSGFYFIRAYTKWMRNGAVLDYAYIGLKVINPYSEELLAVNDSMIYKDNSSIENEFSNSQIQLNKTKYQKGEKISLTLNESELLKACLSIIPSISKANYYSPAKKQLNEYDSLIFYPETRGISISGKIINKQDQTIIPYQKLSLHIKNEKDFISVLSDSLGRFYIALPERYGNIEILVISAPYNNGIVEILIDQDFCNRNLTLKVAPFRIENIEREELLKIAQTHQLDLIYRNKDTMNVERSLLSSFYSQADKSIDFDSFVELDSLSQYFTDLPSWVNIKKTKGKRRLVVSGPEVELQLYEPLMLIDWVPIDDIDKLLAMDPRRIKKFDVITQAYVHGSIIYGGIINIYTRNADFGGFAFPESAIYISYNFFDDQKSVDIRINEVSFPFVNTYFWMPDINLNDHLKSLEIVAPEIKGEYLLLFQSIDSDGKLITQKNLFMVE